MSSVPGGANGSLGSISGGQGAGHASTGHALNASGHAVPVTPSGKLASTQVLHSAPCTHYVLCTHSALTLHHALPLHSYALTPLTHSPPTTTHPPLTHHPPPLTHPPTHSLTHSQQHHARELPERSSSPTRLEMQHHHTNSPTTAAPPAPMYTPAVSGGSGVHQGGTVANPVGGGIRSPHARRHANKEPKKGDHKLTTPVVDHTAVDPVIQSYHVDQL
jgi:hypothetical protein